MIYLHNALLPIKVNFIKPNKKIQRTTINHEHTYLIIFNLKLILLERKCEKQEQNVSANLAIREIKGSGTTDHIFKLVEIRKVSSHELLLLS